MSFWNRLFAAFGMADPGQEIAAAAVITAAVIGKQKDFEAEHKVAIARDEKAHPYGPSFHESFKVVTHLGVVSLFLADAGNHTLRLSVTADNRSALALARRTVAALAPIVTPFQHELIVDHENSAHPSFTTHIVGVSNEVAEQLDNS